MTYKNNAKKSSEPKPQPVDKIYLHGVSATFWANQNDEGQTRINVNIDRNYKGSDEKWHTTNSYNLSSLLALQAVTAEAIRRLMAARDQEDSE